MENKADENTHFSAIPNASQGAQNENNIANANINQYIVEEATYMRYSPRVMVLYVLWYLLFIVTSITFMGLYWPMKCHINVQVWLLLNTIYLVFKLSSALYCRYNEVTAQNIRLFPTLHKITKYLSLYDLIVFIYGCVILKYHDVDCSENSPYLYYLAMTIFTYNIICACLPLVFLILLCCCFPCIFMFFRVFGENNGASEQVIQSLDTKKCDHIDKDYTCAICTDEFIMDCDIKVLPCKHEFHPQCIDEWLMINSTCPLCRRNINSGSVASNVV